MHRLFTIVGATFLIACAARNASTLTEVPPPASPAQTPQQAQAPRVPLTTDRQLLPITPPLSGDAARSPNTPEAVAALIAEGYGDWRVSPGLARVARTLDDAPPPLATDLKHIARFAHLADYQLADDEAMTRAPLLDSTGNTSGAYRPQEGVLAASSSMPPTARSIFCTKTRHSILRSSVATT
jgi:hypothetical protein